MLTSSRKLEALPDALASLCSGLPVGEPADDVIFLWLTVTAGVVVVRAGRRPANDSAASSASCSLAVPRAGGAAGTARNDARDPAS